MSGSTKGAAQRGGRYSGRLSFYDVEKAALELLALYHLRVARIIEPPVPIQEIASQVLGLTIQFAPLAAHSGSPNDERSAAIDVGRKVVHLNPQKSASVRNFALAHEIGHLQLHSVYSDKAPADFESHLVQEKRREQEAERFASFLLMPKYLTDEYARRFGTYNGERVETLAQMFGVSFPAMRIRVRGLGLLGLAGESQLSLPTIGPHVG